MQHIDTVNLKQYIAEIPDYPKPGINFKDITPLLRDPKAFSYTIDRLYDAFKDKGIDAVAAVDARGFVFGAPLAFKLGSGLILIRKKNKLPGQTIKVSYELEYGSATLEVKPNLINQGDRILIVDDLLATGGTALASKELIERSGGKVVGFAFVIELSFLNGRDKLNGYDVVTLVRYDS